MVRNIYLFLVVLSVGFFIVCDASVFEPLPDPVPPGDLVILLTVTETAFDPGTEILDFGMRQIGGTEGTLSGSVGNQGEETVSITALDLGDTVNYSLTVSEVPLELEPGAAADFTLAFAPAASGDKDTTLDITFDDADETTITVNITGEGNAAPAVVFGIDVSGAPNYTEVNGFYIEDGTYSSKPKYKKNGTPDLYVYGYIYGDSNETVWAINDTYITGTPTLPLYPTGPRCYIDTTKDRPYPPERAVADEMDWVENSSAEPPVITLKTGITRSANNTLMSNHHYSDEEGDAETGTTYRWFQSTTGFDGTYQLLAGTDSSRSITYEDDDGTHYKLEVTPVDANGYAGTPVISDPHFVEYSM